MKKITLFTFCLFLYACSFAQRGKTGNLTVSSAVVVNEYTTLTFNASAGNTSITVANSGLNTKGRFSGNLAAGDLIMIIQMQGAAITGGPDPFHLTWAIPTDSSWGNITAYNNAGNYEFAEVSGVPSGTTINLDCGLVNNYTISGHVQVIRVPRYNTLTVNSGGSIGCDAWDSAKGGVAAIEVLGNTVINSGGKIDVSNNGFKGGVLDNDSSTYGVFNTGAQLMSFGKQKGEGIAGHTWMYTVYGGKYCKGAPANGGGGADAHNGGGGGGGNGGVVTNWINGFGNPDVSTANDIAAWKLEYTWLPTFTASGGGRGGYTFSSNNLDPTTNKPNNSSWGGDSRNSNGGWGGRPVDYSTGRLFLGGGGGSGDQDNNFAGAGGNGGGMVYLMSYGTVSGAGTIIANGQNGFNAQGTPAATSYAGQDGAGGAGAGGTVVVNSIGAISGITLNANGGTGGSQVLTKGSFYFGSITEAEGPGGGGSGGYIGTSNTGLTETVTGGANGTTNSPSMVKFPPNGATKGGVGTTATVANFHIVANNDTICSGTSAVLSASLVGTVPGGTTIEWYTAQTGGSPVGSGTTYTTPVLSSNTTYYVGTCPGTYRQAVNVIISGSAATTISPPATVCRGQNTVLNATGGTAYSWSPAASLNNPSIASPTATPTVTTTYTCSITTACGLQKDSVKITVNPLPSVTLSGTTTICAGNSTALTANGGTSYSWNTGATTSSVNVTPPSTTTYTVHVSNSTCTKDTTIKVTVNPLPTPGISGTTPICAGSSTTITATGGTSYSWNTGATTSSITVSPATTTSYTVHVSNGTCNKDTNITITVNSKPTVFVTPPSATICIGGSVSLTANGANTYAWNPSTGLTCTGCANPTANPATTTTYTVIGTSTLGCKDTTNVTVTVGSITAGISGKDSICSGNSTTLTASGGTTYQWSNGATTSTITVSPASNTTYKVVVSSGTCKDSTNLTVVVTSAPSPSVVGNNNICVGDSTTLTASGGTSYSWNTGATASVITVKPAATSSYTVHVSNGSCSRDTNITVVVNGLPVVTISPPATICSGNSTVISATGGSTYSWSNGATTSSITVSPASSTTYSVMVSNGTCNKDTGVTITVNPTPTVTLSGNSSICAGDSATITASGGGTYLWSNGATTSSITVKPVKDSTYTLHVNLGPCPKDTSITVFVNTRPTPTISKGDTLCAGSSVQLNAFGGTSYTWTPAAGLSSSTISNPVATPTTTTQYTVSVANGGCAATDSLLVVVNPMPKATATGTTTITKGQTAVLGVTSGAGDSYSWTPSSTLSCNTCASPVASPSVTTTYYVTITDSAGCRITDSVVVTVKENCGEMFVPNAFSPNGDNNNDVVRVHGNCIQSIEFDIYDRWGNVMFHTTDPNEGWDGKFAGQFMNTGTYVYTLKVLLIDGTLVDKKGDISLIR